MKKIGVIIVMLSAVIIADGPSDEVKPQDYADPKLKAFDNRIWKNLLKYYVHARQIARSTLDELETVKDFAWSSYRYLYAIERAANRAQVIWDNIKNFKAENPADAIIYLEEDVFRRSDLLFEYDIPRIKNEQERLSASREAIRNRANGHIEALNDLLPDGIKFRRKYIRLMELNSSDDKTLNDSSDTDINFNSAILSQASRQIASTEVTDEFSDNQSAILESTIKNAANNGTADPLHQSEMNKLNERNALILSLQENVYNADAVKISSYFLLNKVKLHADELAQKQAVLLALEELSDKLTESEGEGDR